MCSAAGDAAVVLSQLYICYNNGSPYLHVTAGCRRSDLAARCYCTRYARARSVTYVARCGSGCKFLLQLPQRSVPGLPATLQSCYGAGKVRPIHPFAACTFPVESPRAAPVGSSRTPSRTGGIRTATLIRTTAIFMNGQGRARGALSTGSSRQRASTTISCRTDQ